MDVPAPSLTPKDLDGAHATGTAPTTLITSTLPIASKLGFFNNAFPRELRDEIYDRLYQDSEDKVEDTWSEIDYRLTSPLRALRLVNRQFKLEYEDRCSKNKHLSHFLVKVGTSWGEGYFNDAGDDYSDDDEHAFLEFTGPTTHATNMTIIQPACGCSPRDDPNEDTNPWMHSYSCQIRHSFGDERIWALTEPMQNLRRIVIYLTVPRDSCVHKTLLFLNTEKMASALFLGAKYEEIFEFNVLYPGCAFVEGGDNKILATWSKRRGLVIEDEAVKQSIAPELAEQERLKSLGSQRQRVATGGF